VTNDKEFNENVEMDYILSDPEDCLADEEDGLDYFSGDEVSADETEEVTDEFFFAYLLDGPISIHQSGNKKASSSLPDPTTTDAAAVAIDNTSSSVPDPTASSSVPDPTTTDANANVVENKRRTEDAASAICQIESLLVWGKLEDNV
jgi:hypothetical protein